MIYDSIEVIPAKIYFKIVETGNIKLLSTKNTSIEKLKEVWDRVEEEHNTIAPPNKDATKVLKLSKTMEALSAKLESVFLCVTHLRRKEDLELIEILKKYKYKFTGDLKKDLDKIERESKSIKVKIARLNEKMPKLDNSKDSPSFDEAVMSYSAFTGSGFIDTNKITLTQYYALISMGNKKIKALENNSGGKR